MAGPSEQEFLESIQRKVQGRDRGGIRLLLSYDYGMNERKAQVLADTLIDTPGTPEAQRAWEEIGKAYRKQGGGLFAKIFSVFKRKPQEGLPASAPPSGEELEERRQNFALIERRNELLKARAQATAQEQRAIDQQLQALYQEMARAGRIEQLSEEEQEQLARNHEMAQQIIGQNLARMRQEAAAMQAAAGEREEEDKEFQKLIARERPAIDKFNASIAMTPEQQAEYDARQERINELGRRHQELQRQIAETAVEEDRIRLQAERKRVADEAMALREQDKLSLRQQMRSGLAGAAAGASLGRDDSLSRDERVKLQKQQDDLWKQINDLQKQRENATEQEQEQLGNQVRELQQQATAINTKLYGLASPGYLRTTSSAGLAHGAGVPQAIPLVSPPTEQPENGVPASQVLKAAAKSAGGMASSALSQASAFGSKAKAFGSKKITLPGGSGKRPGLIFGTFFVVLFGLFVWAVSELNPLYILVVGAVLMLAVFLSRLREELSAGLLISIILMLALHGFLYAKNYPFSAGIAILIVMALVMMTIIAIISGASIKTITIIDIAAIVWYAIPAGGQYLVEHGYLGSAYQTAIILVVTLVPLWVVLELGIFSSQNPDTGVGAIFRAYAVMFVIGVLFALIASAFTSAAVLASMFGGNAGDAKLGFKEGVTMVKDSWGDSWDRVTKVISRATDPGAYYTGQVEDNKKKPLGVTLTLRPQDRIVNNETPIIIFGTVYAKSFVGEKVTIHPMCVIDKKDSPEGTPDPVTMDVIFGTSKSFECEFDPERLPDKQWRKGSYPITAQATFPFETWAYAKYTFVDGARIKNIAMQGLEPRQVLDITDEVPIFTSGPVAVGIGGSGQMVEINPDKDPIVAAGTRVGFTLDTAWEKGKLQGVNRFELKVPQPFELTDCDRNLTEKQEDPNDPQYTSYVFENPAFDEVNTYSSVTCKLAIDKTRRDDARQLLSGGDKTVRSFIAVANYRYTIQEKTAVTVR